MGKVLESYPPKLRQLQEALRQGYPKEATRTAHTLKGSAVIFGTTAAAELADAIETLVEGGWLDEARVLAGTLGTELRRLADFFRQFRQGVAEHLQFRHAGVVSSGCRSGAG